MKNFLIFSFAFLLLTFSGCIEIKTLITVNNDGSGTIEETVIMSDKVIEMMKSFSTAFTSDSTQQQDFDIFNENSIKDRAAGFGNGVTYISGEKIQEGSKEGFKALYSFRNLNDVTLSKIPQSQIPLDITEATAKDYTFKFIKGSPAEIIILLPSSKDSVSNDEEARDSSGKLSSADSLNGESNQDSAFTQEALELMKDLQISLVLNTGNSIVETNAAYVNGTEITLFEFDFNKLLNDKEKLQELMKLQSEDYEQIKDVLKNIPGIKVETSEEIRVKFN
jgi:hypothetical protein